MLKRKHKGYPKLKEGLEAYLNKRNEFFKSIWNKRPHICEITGEKLGSPNSLYFHHILPKQKYKNLEFIEENIVLLHPHVHASVEMDMYKYEEINKRRKYLKEKYGIK